MRSDNTATTTASLSPSSPSPSPLPSRSALDTAVPPQLLPTRPRRHSRAAPQSSPPQLQSLAQPTGRPSAASPPPDASLHLRVPVAAVVTAAVMLHPVAMALHRGATVLAAAVTAAAVYLRLAAHHRLDASPLHLPVLLGVCVAAFREALLAPGLQGAVASAACVASLSAMDVLALAGRGEVGVVTLVCVAAFTLCGCTVGARCTQLLRHTVTHHRAVVDAVTVALGAAAVLAPMAGGSMQPAAPRHHQQQHLHHHHHHQPRRAVGPFRPRRPSSAMPAWMATPSSPPSPSSDADEAPNDAASASPAAGLLLACAACMCVALVWWGQLTAWAAVWTSLRIVAYLLLLGLVGVACGAAVTGVASAWRRHGLLRPAAVTAVLAPVVDGASTPALHTTPSQVRHRRGHTQPQPADDAQPRTPSRGVCTRVLAVAVAPCRCACRTAYACGRWATLAVLRWVGAVLALTVVVAVTAVALPVLTGAASHTSVTLDALAAAVAVDVLVLVACVWAVARLRQPVFSAVSHVVTSRTPQPGAVAVGGLLLAGSVLQLAACIHPSCGAGVAAIVVWLMASGWRT